MKKILSLFVLTLLVFVTSCTLPNNPPVDEPGTDIAPEMVIHGGHAVGLEILPKGGGAPFQPVAVGGIILPGDHPIGKVGATEFRKNVEDHAAAQYPEIDVIVGLPDHLLQLFKGGGLFRRLEDAVI